MAGPHPSPWTRLLLAALLSISFPGAMGESDTPLPLQHPSWRGLNFQGTALIKVAGCGEEALTQTFTQTLTQPFNKQPPPASRAAEP